MEIPAGMGISVSKSKAPGTPKPMKLAKYFGWCPGETLYKFDFEDGKRPAIFDLGIVKKGPARRSDNYCLLAESCGYKRHAVRINSSGSEVFTYSGALVISFDYWVGKKTTFVSIHLRNKTQKQDYHFSLRDIRREKWTRATIRFADLQPTSDKTRSFDKGDVISEVQLFTLQEPEYSLYIDNVAITRYAPGIGPQTSGK